MRVLLVDAYDSFVYIIYQYLLELHCQVDVVRNDLKYVQDIDVLRYDFIVLGPGPGHPSDSNYFYLINRAENKVPILGICLGHQAIGLYYKCAVVKARVLMHGKKSVIQHDSQGCFSLYNGEFTATRYHSLVVEKVSVDSDLIVTAKSIDDNHIMGLRHKKYPIESLQFHPESISTESGFNLFKSGLAAYT